MLFVLFVGTLLLLVLPSDHRCTAFLVGKIRRRPASQFLTLDNAKRSIFGENIVACRSFELKTPKVFDFVGSYKSFNNIPKFPVPEIAFIGRSNVGKSSLLNCLTGSHKSIAVVGRTPGTTQSVNIFQCSDRSGSICTFADLPGFGFAKLSRSQQDEISQLLKDYFSARGSLKLVMLLVDPRRDPSPADLDTFGFLVSRGVPVVVVATKVDKLSREEMRTATGKIKRSFAAAVPDEDDDEEDEEDEDQIEGQEYDLARQVQHDGNAKDGTAGGGGGPGGAADALPVILFSSVTGYGQGDLWKAIRDNIVN